MEQITNEQKAQEIANDETLYGEDPDENSKIEECYIAAMAMAKWKDKQFTELINALPTPLKELIKAYAK